MASKLAEHPMLDNMTLHCNPFVIQFLPLHIELPHAGIQAQETAWQQEKVMRGVVPVFQAFFALTIALLHWMAGWEPSSQRQPLTRLSTQRVGMLSVLQQLVFVLMTRNNLMSDGP